MRILVVDDEYYARKALIQTIGDWSAEVVVEEAENGEEALEKLKSQQYDLLFSDIRMPILDGLQLAAILFEQYPSVYNVIVSGYEDFQYAQQAIVYKVEHYLLKPVERKDIFTILDRIQGHLAKFTQDSIQEQLISLFHEEQSLVDRVITLPTMESYNTLVIQAAAINEEWLSLHLTAKLRENGLDTYLIRDQRYAHTFIALLIQNQIKLHRTTLVEMCSHIVKEFTVETSSHMSIGISSNYNSHEDMIKSYSEAKNAILYRLFDDNHVGVFLYDEINQTYRYRFELLDELLQPLYNKMISNQEQEANEIIARLIKLIIELKLSVHTLHDTCAKLIAVLNSIIEMVNENDSVPKPYLNPLDLYEFNHIGEIIGYFSQHVHEVTTKLAQVKKKIDMADQMKDYVEKNYPHNILLEDIAKNMFYSDVSYLSRLFKKKIGSSFSNYLLSVRMYNAKKLLETNPQLSVAEIATAVGFNDYSYFIQMYKKFYGVTPGQSRKKDPG